MNADDPSDVTRAEMSQTRSCLKVLFMFSLVGRFCPHSLSLSSTRCNATLSWIKLRISLSLSVAGNICDKVHNLKYITRHTLLPTVPLWANHTHPNAKESKWTSTRNLRSITVCCEVKMCLTLCVDTSVPSNKKLCRSTWICAGSCFSFKHFTSRLHVCSHVRRL